MAKDHSTQFAPSWYSAFGATGHEGPFQRTRAFVRLWRAFMRARLIVAVVLLALQLFLQFTDGNPSAQEGPPWLSVVAGLYLANCLLMLWRWRPLDQQRSATLQWLLTVGIDILVFMLLQVFQAGGINYTLLFALPVLLTSILGSQTLGLGAAAAVTICLLADAWLGGPRDVSTMRLLQTALAGTGFFMVSVLAHQLALRLAREEALSASSQAAARTQAQVNELVIESLSVGVLVVDPHGVVRSANPAALQMLIGEHFPSGARLLLSARTAWSHLAGLVQQTFLMGQALEAETDIEHEARPIQRVHARTRLTTLDGQGGGLCVLFLEDLREVEARVRTEKLASMGRMSAAVAHEIRNPLTAITQANALLDEEVKDAGQKRLTRMIEQNASRLSRIVDDILNVARAQPNPGEGQAPRLPLDVAVRHVCTEWSAQNQAQGRFTTHLHAPKAMVEFDPEHLRRLLVNLLDNAARHASAAPGAIRVISQPSGPEHVRLSVWSNGAPLEASVQRHLFEPFFSSESRSSGLGLYICRELCERYGAKIAYQRARLDQQDGNEFFAVLPLAGWAERRARAQRPTEPGALDSRFGAATVFDPSPSHRPPLGAA